MRNLIRKINQINQSILKPAVSSIHLCDSISHFLIGSSFPFFQKELLDWADPKKKKKLIDF
jgi:hypothetical protein